MPTFQNLIPKSVEGAPPIGRIVNIEFPSFEAAETFETSPEALAAGEIRHRTATSRIFVVEGWKPHRRDP
ncbi:hypothetical protein GCM10022276_22760 [Sphingomonas limnosediminicola]|uniref:DUF1330 domain-containing protein n=2 Tax=Sphingomonas limnosediminicola TaxID=940133 RepID=A0ABP7LPK7_9SPHN